MTFEQFQAAVRSERIPMLLLVHGEESYLVDQAGRLVVNAVVAPENRDFNLTVVHGRDLKGHELIDQARTLPVFASHRLVVIRNVHEAPAEQLEAFATYLDDPVPETFLLITAAGIDKRRKFFQKFAQVGEIIVFRRLFDNQLPQFIRDLIALLLAAGSPAAAQEKLHFTYLWHLEQPIYWPDRQAAGADQS